jgi:hypothetical protein
VPYQPPRYSWPGMVRAEVRGTVRRRLRALAAQRSRYAPAAYAVRRLAAAACDRDSYAQTRNPFYREMHAIMLGVAA